MRAQPVDLIGGFYKDDSLPWSCQDTVNWLPVQAEVSGTRSVAKLSTPPGLKPWLTVGSGPVRGMHDLEGGRFVVSGQTLCRVNPNNSVDPIGTIPGVGRVQMTHNQFKTGYQLLVENGQGGGGYVYDTNTNTLTKIADEGYPGSISSDYLDQYILGVEPQGRFWFHSNLADATDYNTLDRYEAESAPDKIVGLAANASEVVVFGERTTEFFFNSGAATGTFQNRRSSITKGCASRHTIQKLDNSVFWLGNDGVVYRLENGYAARPVSTRPLEKAISGYNWPEAIAYVWEDRGHKIYYLTFPDGQTFGYDVITGLWHRRESFGLNRWRLSHIISWGRDWFGGDFQSGRIWQLDWDYIMEGQDPLVRRRVSPVAADNQSAMTNPMAELVFDVGRGPETVAIPFPTNLAIEGFPPGALLGEAYPEFSFTASGGTSPYQFFLVSGSLPVGMSLATSGALTGSPAIGGQSTFTVRVFDANGNWTEKSYTINVVAGRLGLAVPKMVFAGGYEALTPIAPITTGTISDDGAFAISPNTVFAYAGFSGSPFGTLYRLNTATNTYAEFSGISPAPTAAVQAAAFSHSGSLLALAYVLSGTLSIHIYKWDGDQFTKVSTQAMPNFIGKIMWSPDDTKLSLPTYTDAPEYGVRVTFVDPDTGVMSGYVNGNQAVMAQTAEGFSWSKDGKYLAEWSNNNLKIWEPTPTIVVFKSQSVGAPSASGRGAFFSDDGNFVYTVGGAGSAPICVYPFSEGALGGVISPANQPAISINDSDFSGGYLALGRFGGPPGNRSILVYRCTGATIQQVANQPSYGNDDLIAAIRWTI